MNSNSPQSNAPISREATRLAALDSYRILDTAPEAMFDDIVAIAAEICRVPMALITLVDRKRQWFKAALGIAASETPREGGFCAHAITQEGVLLVEDATKDPLFSNHPMVTADPNLRFYAGTPLVTPEGFAIGSLCVMDSKPGTLSTTQRKALEALGRQVMTQLELRRLLTRRDEGAAQFQLFAETLPNHVWTSPPNGLLDWFNDRVYEYSGLKQSQLDGTGWASIVHEDDVSNAGEKWAAALASGENYETEFRLRRADGTYRWHLARAVPILTGGVVNRWVGTNTDIHERKISEVQSTRDLARIWSLSQEMMMVHDFNGLISAANPASTTLLGFTNEEMMGHLLAEFLHPEDFASTAAEFAKLSNGASTVAFENRYRTKDGSYRLLDWTAVPFDDVIHSVARDITKEREIEEALRQSQKMEAVGQLSGGIAHDFNNLLQGIVGSLDLVKKRILQGRVDELDRFIAGAMTSAHRASALTHRLLAFSRRQPLNPRATQANTLVASMEDLLRRTIGEHIKLELVMAGGLWITRCDSNQLENAILNLVINARDAMPNGGALTVETNNAHIDSAYASRHQGIKAGQYVCICVSDTGTGMSADTISKAFEPFYTTKPIGEGTGLGLSMIYGFAKQSDGFARIYSELGKGTTVKLYLPRHDGDAIDDDPLLQLTGKHKAFANETVLVVEDEAVVRGLIVEVLNDLGYETIEADDGPSGLAVLQSDRHIDLLISDMGLPGLNGRQIVDASRAQRPNLKVLYMTGYAENAAIASGFLQPGMSMITKPFAMEMLATKIHEILGKRK